MLQPHLGTNPRWRADMRIALRAISRYYQSLVAMGKRLAGSALAALERITGRSQSAATKLSVKSALNPLLWLCAIVSAPCFALATLMALIHSELFILSCILCAIGSVPILTGCVVGIRLAFFDPDKLQSEDYQIRQQAMEIIKQKGSPIEMIESSLEAMVNPAIQLIGGDNG
jgi:hypothetical protein